MWWGRRGWRVVRYQRNLRRRTWTLGHADVPASERGLFLRCGFEWTATHTQRYADTQKSRLPRLVAPNAIARWVRAHEDVWADWPVAPAIHPAAFRSCTTFIAGEDPRVPQWAQPAGLRDRGLALQSGCISLAVCQSCFLLGVAPLA